MRTSFTKYISILSTNFNIFLKNYQDTYLPNFNIIISSLESIWGRLGKEKDLSGHSHVGLFPFVNLLIRHSIFGFQHIASYQSFLCWLTFRPGLEALLILGKFVDDPNNANIWKNRESDQKAYKQAFEGKKLISKILPRSADFQQVLKRLNDNFMHPNPDFVYRDTTILDEGGHSLFLKTEYFDTVKNVEIHEGHLLSFLNLLDQICYSSDRLVQSLCGPATHKQRPERLFSESADSRASYLASRNPVSKKVMLELGLWGFERRGN